MDNCSHNGDKVRTGVFAYADRWLADGLVPQEFVDYVHDESLITFPWSMIDKITPRPHAKVKEMLAADGFADNDYIETSRHTLHGTVCQLGGDAVSRRRGPLHQWPSAPRLRRSHLYLTRYRR